MTSSESRAEPADPSRVRYQRVVLLGFMASGKTAVGRGLAERLGWRHVDLDAEIERFAGKKVAEIFAGEGEMAFRDLEVRLTPSFAGMHEVVLSTGGGWITNPGLFDALPADTLTVWLEVSPGTVLDRIAASRNQPVRPLLSGDDPRRRIESLLAEREPSYRRADVIIQTDQRRVEEIVGQLTDIVLAGRAPGPEGSI